MTAAERIKTICTKLEEHRDRVALLESEIEELLPELLSSIEDSEIVAYLAEHVASQRDGKPFDVGELELGSAWPCPKSPVGQCVYDVTQDPCRDVCLLCGQPEERK
jgi:hypothetical protein